MEKKEEIRKHLSEYIERKKIFNVGASEMEYLVSYISQELDKAREEGYIKGREYQAKLDRELYGVSFEKIKSGDF